MTPPKCNEKPENATVQQGIAATLERQNNHPSGVLFF
jgi:hypothetical protein